MSAKNYFKNKWVDMLVQTFLSGLLMLIILALGFRDADERELLKTIDSKANKEEVESVRDYVDARFEVHISSEQKAYNSLEKLMKAYLDGQKELIESIDHRLARIENKD